MLKTYGVSTMDGTITPCRAKPENRGTGNCPHGEHLEMDPKDVNSFNEAALAKHFDMLETIKPAVVPRVTPSHIAATLKARALNREEFTESSNALADSFPETDWDEIRKISGDINKVYFKGPKHNASTRVNEFLESDNPKAVLLREFLGNEINMNEFSRIIADEVGRMTLKETWDSRGNAHNVSRIVLSRINNDMTKRRYIASVLFFGGRCCYCNNVLRKGAGRYQASGEHITPMNPKSPPPGATRYGNMALACMTCNKERGNTELNEWVNKTKLIPEKSKENVLGRIKAFRDFALYEDYTLEQSEVIKNEISKLQDLVNSYPKVNNLRPKESFEIIKNSIYASVQEVSDLIQL